MNKKSTHLDIERSFTYHRPHGDQPERYERLRSKARELAYTIVECCPSAPDTTLALRLLEDCVMRANKSIAVNEVE